MEKQELSPETIRILYKNCLYSSGDKVETPSAKNGSDTYSNTNRAQQSATNKSKFSKIKFVVFTDSPLVQNNSDQRFKFLSEIIRACKISMEEGILTDIETVGKDYDQLLLRHQPEVVLLFGILASEIQLPMIFPHFQVQQIGKQKFISAPALELLEPDKSLKTKLWSCLKQAFSI